MGLFDLFKRNINLVQRKQSSDGLIINKKIDSIPREISSLMWFYDGPFKNISLKTPELSAISFAWPVAAGESGKLPYWPEYESMTSQQRFKYLTWLENIDKPIEIGYVFEFYYGLERHIFDGSMVDESVNMIRRLKKFHNQPSFNGYSNNAVIYAAAKTKNTKYLDYVDSSYGDSNILILVKGGLQKKLEASDIIKISKSVGWYNQGYIKKFPNFFEKILKKELIDTYGTDYFEMPDKLTNVGKKELILANNHLSKSTSEIKSSSVVLSMSAWDLASFCIPDFMQCDEIVIPLLKLLRLAHGEVKKALKEKRKTEKSPLIKPDLKSQNEFLRSVGLDYIAERNEKWQKEEKRREKLNKIWLKGEELSKKGNPDESNKAILALLKTEFANQSDIYWRLAINYRKLKDYQSEITIIEKALNKEKMYWSFHSKQQFENRLNKAKILLEKK